jgi:hypothetical protein
VSLDERAFFSDRNETRPSRFTCTRCRRTNEYTVRWVRRVKKDRLPPGADERDRAKFAKLRDHLIRVDDEVVCKSCGKKFEIPSLHSLLFVDQLEGLPRDVEDEDDDAAEAPAPQAAGAATPGAAGAPSPARAPQDRAPHARPPQDRSPQDRPSQDRSSRERPAQGRPAPDRPAQDRPAQDQQPRGPRRMTSPSRGWR